MNVVLLSSFLCRIEKLGLLISDDFPVRGFSSHSEALTSHVSRGSRGVQRGGAEGQTQPSPQRHSKVENMQLILDK